MLPDTHPYRGKMKTDISFVFIHVYIYFFLQVNCEDVRTEGW